MKISMRTISKIGISTAAILGISAAASAQTPLYDIVGDGSNDRLGVDADAAGDVNNDGVQDFIIGAPENGNVFAGGVGYARVYSGSDGSPIITLFGSQGAGSFGTSVAGVGDIDADGFDDFVVGSPFNDGGGLSRGRIDVFSGQTGGIIFSRFGSLNGDQLGENVIGLGDVNNDGTPDLAACAFSSDLVALNTGTVRVYSGLNGDILHNFEGTISNAHLGVSMDDIGDFNGDGFDDILAGGLSGPVTVFSGQTGAILKDYPDPVGGSAWGVSASSLGDITGDGVHDVIIGGTQNAVLGVGGPGFINVLNGATGGLLIEEMGSSMGDAFGASADSAGDFNGDGVTDFIVGATVAADNTNPGYARIYSGSNSAILATFNAASNGSNLGAWVGLLGDLNGDGSVEVGVAQPEFSAPGPFTGTLQVYTGVPELCDPPQIYCLSTPNTTGLSAKIAWSGSNSFAANDLVLLASDCPANQMGIFFFGPNQVFIPFGSGVRCVGGGLFRKPPVTTTDANGDVIAALDLNGLPNANGQILEGETWNFQLWFRDPGDGNANTNLTDALEVTFCP
ncbi:MAG: hypothetical protein ACI8X5_000811 [Planctomycetota bacterium]|jgi:hypothetical protein